MTMTIFMRLGLTTHTPALARFSTMYSSVLRAVPSFVCISLLIWALGLSPSFVCISSLIYIIHPRFFSPRYSVLLRRQCEACAPQQRGGWRGDCLPCTASFHAALVHQSCPPCQPSWAAHSLELGCLGLGPRVCPLGFHTLSSWDCRHRALSRARYARCWPVANAVLYFRQPCHAPGQIHKYRLATTTK